MNDKRIKDIQKLAKSIDVRINLFEGFCPKNTKEVKGEALFWREIVNIYGLFADCDRVQIKNPSANLFELMNRYQLISSEEYKNCLSFWKDVSVLRKCFCHNTDDSLYYQNLNIQQISRYLNKAFIISTNKPQCIDEIKSQEWNILTSNIERRFDDYIEVLNKGLVNWKDSEDKEEIIEEWLAIFAKALINDKELIQNVIADIAMYNIMNYKLDIRIPAYSKSIIDQLNRQKYSEKEIYDVLLQMNATLSNKEIIMESIRKMKLSL